MFLPKMDVIIPLFVKKGRQFFVVFVNRAISRLKRLILAIPLFLAKNGHYYSVVLSKKGAIYPLFRLIAHILTRQS